MAAQDNNKRSFASRIPFYGSMRTEKTHERESSEEEDTTSSRAPKWSFGVLNDKGTVEVPGKSSHNNLLGPKMHNARYI